MKTSFEGNALDCSNYLDGSEFLQNSCAVSGKQLCFFRALSDLEFVLFCAPSFENSCAFLVLFFVFLSD